MKIKLLILTLLFSAVSWGQATDLFISEYVEGSSSNKYIEIYNGTGASINLSDYRLRLYANGAATPTNDVSLSGTINSGSVIVYQNSAATLYAGINNTALAFNGDDAVVLFKISTNSNVDIFGRIGNDPGTAWTATGYTTLDKTLRRKSNVCGGVTVNPTGTGVGAFSTLSTEWDIFNIDIVSDLGSHVMSCGPSPEINVTGNGNTILTGDVLPTTTDFTDFGNVNLGSSVADSFVVQNTGTANLTVSSVVISGANAADFAVTTSPVGTIANGANAGLTITFTPSAIGLRNATVTINNNDSNEAAYTFAIVGNGTCVPPVNPVGAITVSANPSCGPATLSYPAGSYWQTAATGTLTTSPTSSNYTLNATGTVYVRNYNGSCWSAGALSSGAITINTPIAITTQPVASTIFSGSSTTFSVTATGTTPTYQWQVNTGSGFVNLTNTGSYSGVTSATMTISAATVGMNGYLYQCVVSGAVSCTPVTSSSALLTVTLYVPAGTVLKPGDLVFVGYDATAAPTCKGAQDKFYIATLVDIIPGTQFMVVNSRYESGAAANVRTDRWYGGGNDPYQDPGILTFTWGGATSIAKGSIISFRADALVVSEIRIDNVAAPSLTYAASLDQCNIHNTSPDQIYLMQGLFTHIGVKGVDRYSTFAGRVLYGLTNGAAWVPFANAVSNANSVPGRVSRLPDDIECFNIESIPANGVRFYNNSALHTGTKYQLLSALNTVANWTIPVSSACLDTTDDFTSPYTGAAVGQPFIVNASNPDGTWTGATDTDWFKCANWEGLAVPKATDDVIIPALPVNQPIIGASPLKYPIGAFSNNLTLDNGSTLGMPSTLSQLNLYANWTNNSGSTNFSEGSGTVYFEGSAPQVINAVTPEGTETFHNVVLNNNFTTSVSNDIIANGDLTVGIGKTLEVSPLDYVQVTDNVTNNGTFNILNTGSLVQINDLGVNTGNISYERIASVLLQDYVYWSSPVNGFDVNSISPLTPAYYHWLWNPTVANTNGGLGNWQNASTTMTAGQGYIVRAPNGFSNATNQNWTATFNNGVPRNGVYTPTIARGTYTDVDYAGTNGVLITANDDNWNLLGNPYPSAISIGSFLTANPQLDGFVRLWTHHTLPVSAVNPFYNSFVYNYTVGDYVAINGAGATSGPGTLSVIGGGQGFFTLMLPGAATTSTATFNNAMRDKGYSNSQFYKTASPKAVTLQEVGGNIERSRIWIDLVSPTMETTRTLMAYVEGATLEKDRMFDALTDYKATQNFYSLLENEVMTIQGRPLPFDVNDQVPMGIKIPTNGTYTIAIATVDGLFAGNAQKIYIEDKLLGTINDITAVPYQFTATQGITNNRFVLRYTNQALSTTDHDLANNAVTVFASTAGISINSSTESIKDYTVYNVLGQTLAEKYNVNANQSVVNTIAKNNQALIVKIVLTNGQAIIKKVIF